MTSSVHLAAGGVSEWVLDVAIVRAVRAGADASLLGGRRVDSFELRWCLRLGREHETGLLTLAIVTLL